jgi:hypothetical protein
VIEIEVLEGNWQTVSVFQRCKLDLVGGGMGIWWHGVAATEVLAVCRMLRVPRVEWGDVLDGVQVMAAIVAKERNDETSSAFKKKR